MGWWHEGAKALTCDAAGLQANNAELTRQCLEILIHKIVSSNSFESIANLRVDKLFSNYASLLVHRTGDPSVVLLAKGVDVKEAAEALKVRASIQGADTRQHARENGEMGDEYRYWGEERRGKTRTVG